MAKVAKIYNLLTAKYKAKELITEISDYAVRCQEEGNHFKCGFFEEMACKFEKDAHEVFVDERANYYVIEIFEWLEGKEDIFEGFKEKPDFWWQEMAKLFEGTL